MKNNNIKESIKDIKSILDREYFHTCTEVHENGVISWQVYYKNLPAKAYYSNKNKPLLTSKENSTADIYKLRDKFEKEKDIELMKVLKELIPLGSEVNKSMVCFEKNLSIYAEIVLVVAVIISFINLLLIHNIILSVTMLIAIVILGLSSVHFQKQNERQRRETNKRINEIYLKQKIKNQGFYFVDRIRIGG